VLDKKTTTSNQKVLHSFVFLIQESQKLQAAHARHAFYFEAKASAGEPLSEEKRKVEISSLYDAMGCNKRLIELVLDLSDELHELVCMDINIPTMPVDKVIKGFDLDFYTCGRKLSHPISWSGIGLSA